MAHSIYRTSFQKVISQIKALNHGYRLRYRPFKVNLLVLTMKGFNHERKPIHFNLLISPWNLRCFQMIILVLPPYKFHLLAFLCCCMGKPWNWLDFARFWFRTSQKHLFAMKIELLHPSQSNSRFPMHSHKKIMKSFAFTKRHDFCVFTSEHTLFSRRSAYRFSPLLQVTPGHWPDPRSCQVCQMVLGVIDKIKMTRGRGQWPRDFRKWGWFNVHFFWRRV